MKQKYAYPITISQILDHLETVNPLFIKKNRHKEGTYIGVAILEYDFNREEVGVSFGDKLSLSDNDSANFPLSVLDKKGKLLGTLPFSHSIVPKKLLDLGIKVWCYAEAVEIRSDIPMVAVSIYCEKY